MEVVEEVAQVEQQPARQLRRPEGEEPAAQVASADHVPETLEGRRVVSLEGRVHRRPYREVQVRREPQQKSPTPLSTSFTSTSLRQSTRATKSTLAGGAAPLVRWLVMQEPDQESGEQEVSVAPALPPQEQGEDGERHEQGV